MKVLAINKINENMNMMRVEMSNAHIQTFDGKNNKTHNKAVEIMLRVVPLRLF